jgi:hypothetical protein
MDSRKHTRSIFANLLAGDTPDGSGTTAREKDRFDDLFGEELLSARALQQRGGRVDALPGDGFDGFGAFGPFSGDGHGRGPSLLEATPPVWTLIPSAEEGGSPGPEGPTLDALPGRPSAGAHRVVAVAGTELHQLNERLDAGWRITQMLPGSSPGTFVVALRYAGRGAKESRAA